MGNKRASGLFLSLSSISCIFNGAYSVTSTKEKVKPGLANIQISVEEQTSSTRATLKATAFLKQQTGQTTSGV